MMEDINNSMVAFRKCIELDPNNDLEKLYLIKFLKFIMI